MENNNRRWIPVILGTMLILVFLVANAGVTWLNYFNFIDSDDASELILAKLLAQEGGIMSPNWYYSTEIRVLNTQLIYSVLFHFFSDFKTVRIIGQIVLSTLMLASYYFCLRSVDAEKARNRFFLTGFLLLIPMSDAWTFLNMKSYYVPHIMISFFAFGLYFRVKNAEGIKKSVFFYTLGILLGFGAGLGGIRSLQLTYIPMGLYLCLELWGYLERRGWEKVFEDKHFWAIWIENMSCAAAALAGALMNTFILSGLYHFKTYVRMKYEYFSAGSVFDVWNDLVQAIGYVEESHIFTFDGICNTVALALTAVLLYNCFVTAKKYMSRIMKFEYCLNCRKIGGGICDLAFISVLTFIFNMFLLVITHYSIPRYVMACFPVMTVFLFSLEKWHQNKRRIVYIVFCLSCILLGAREYKNVLCMADNEAKRGLVSFIEENAYSIGLATFWNGNIISELTNEKIQFINLELDKDTGELSEFHWLCRVEIPEEIQNSILLILTREEDELVILPERENFPIIFEDENYVVYEVSTLEKMEFWE